MKYERADVVVNCPNQVKISQSAWGMIDWGECKDCEHHGRVKCNHPDAEDVESATDRFLNG